MWNFNTISIEGLTACRTAVYLTQRPIIKTVQHSSAIIIRFISEESDNETHEKHGLSVDNPPRQNIRSSQHWSLRPNFEEDETLNPSSPRVNISSTVNCCSRRSDPFLPENRIPLPKFHFNRIENNCYEGVSNDEGGRGGVFFYSVPSPTNGRRRNERERQRVRSVNEGFERLRRYVPVSHQCQNGSECVVATVNRVRRCQRRRCSKVDVLKAAIMYIRHLEGLLDGEELN
jgi:achaete-scute complex protein